MDMKDVLNGKDIEVIFEAKSMNYGTNGPDYDNGKIGYNGTVRAFYTVSKLSDDLHLMVAVKLDGEILFTSHSSSKITTYLKNPEVLLKQTNINTAISNFKKSFNLLIKIITKYRNKLPILKFVARSEFQARRIEQFLRSGMVRNALGKFNYELKEHQKTNDGIEYILGRAESGA